MIADYLPSYLETKIPTSLALHDPPGLPLREQGLYYHAYIGYLLGITTTTGLTRTWNAFDSIRQLIHCVQQTKPPVPLPLDNATAREQLEFQKFMRNVDGATRLRPVCVPDNGYEISRIRLVPAPLMFRAAPGLRGKRVELVLSRQGFPDERYMVGALAIAASMTYIMQTRFFEVMPPGTYPFLVAQKIAEFTCPAVAANGELLLAVCDMALMHPLPGWAFNAILQTLGEGKRVPDNGEKMITVAMECFTRWGYNPDQHLQQLRDQLTTVITYLYGHPYFSISREWLTTVISRGTELREYDTTFMLRLYRDSAALGTSWGHLFQHLGGPHCINDLSGQYLCVPDGLQPVAAQIHPRQLKVSARIHDLLVHGKAAINCNLRETCKTAPAPRLVDKRCFDHPWRRAGDARLCPYTAAWTHYGFDHQHFTISGEPMQAL